MRAEWGFRWAAFFFAVGLVGCSDSSSSGPSNPRATHPFTIATVAEGLEHPWAIAFAGDDILVTERPGRLRVIRDGQLLPQPVSGVPAVFASGHGGLLDVIVDPGFAQNRLIYLSYSAGSPLQSTTCVARGRYQSGALSAVEVLLCAQPEHESDQHFGSRLLLQGEALYVTVGDRHSRYDAQNLMDDAGSILRLRSDGTIPADNPFVSDPNARHEIFSYGHRNPQGIAIHPASGEVWATEHGPRGGDEINVIRPGHNYGWPVITYGTEYDGTPIGEGTHKEGMEQPLHYWTPSIAPSGMAFYTGDRFPRWRGNLFIGALSGRDLYRVVLEGQRVVEQERLLTELGERIRDVRQGPDGLLWVATDATDGRLLRLEPVAQ